MSTEVNPTDPEGAALKSEGITLVAFVTALTTALVLFGLQMILFVLLKDKLARIYKPKAYLVPERERTAPPPKSLFGWLFAIFKVKDREIINKCGLDAYFFLRYLQTLLVIFIPLGLLTLPILLPINILGGRGSSYALEFGNRSDAGAGANSTTANVTGLDILAWGNVRPTHTNRYWAHLVLAIICIVWVCGVFFTEMRVYIKVRQDYLTSAEHRLRASATTILVSAVPAKWLTAEALGGLYDVFPGGIRNIWINRNFGELLDKIHERDAVFQKLEGAQTELIRAAKRAHKKELEQAEKKARSDAKVSKQTKEEKAQKLRAEDQDAQILAQSGGVSSGDPHQVPHNVDDAMAEEEERQRNEDHGHTRKGSHKIPLFGAGFAAVEKGIRKGLGEVDEFGDNLVGGARGVGKDLNNQVETTNGFQHINDPTTPDDDGDYDQYGRYRGRDSALPYGMRPDTTPKKKKTNPDVSSPPSSEDKKLHGNEMNLSGNTAGRSSNQFGGDGARDYTSGKKFYEFWKPPSGGFVSPIPTGYNDRDEFPFGTQDPNKASLAAAEAEEKKSAWQKFVSVFSSDKNTHPDDYPKATNPEYREDANGAVWEKYLKASDRPTHRLPVLGFLPLGKKVDTIYWGREELARLNLEIEFDQKHPERFPMMNSAFIQFNHQVAAHMASQSVTHHVPKIMAPRITEISPKDVIWDNMSIHWWESWLRTAFVIAIVAGMVILWTFPVAFTASLSNLSGLAQQYSWLNWLERIPRNVLNGISGVLPALVLAILLALVPMIFNWLAHLQGAKTGMQKQESVQQYYFAFLFVQVFLVVSISNGFFKTILNQAGKDITSIPDLLATNLPKASNYFFSYMILQALGTSSGTLLQIVTLIMWYVLPKIFDNTARQKWKRNTTLPNITWGSYFPVYTNFACIGLIYIIVSPIIVFFAIITFTLLWIANRYNMLYVSRFELDTGGLLYPRALNQTFTGLYFMQLCLIGLFFLVRDEEGEVACFPQAIIMIIILIFTIIYQVLLNWSFGPLLRHLPITFEDEAVLRDEAFNRAQAQRLGIDREDDSDNVAHHQHDGAMEMSRLNGDRSDVRASQDNKHSKFNPLSVAQGAGTWAYKSGRKIGNVTFGLDNGTHKKRRNRDLEAQAKIADALYGGYNDELEDLTPEERDSLVKHAFQHEALRARRPTIWIPRDDIGVSDDEIQRTRDFAGKNIWISNIGAALDGKSRVLYGKNPPDFSEVDLINL